MAENTKKPAIRFAGFSEAWEQRKLGDIGKCQSGIGFPDAEQGGKIGIPFYKVSDMNNYGNEQEMTCANNYVTDEQIIRKNWKPIMEVPAVIFAKVGAAIMLNRKRLCHFPFLLDNNTMAYKFGEKWDTNFGKTLFEKIDLTELVQVGALPSYNATDVENIDIKIPTDMNEQRVLGQYFSNLDNLITLHQRKYEKLSNVKKSMLEKMFPKNGSNVPEIRFKGFTEAWEQSKLGEVGTTYTGLSGKTKEDFGHGNGKFVTYMNVFSNAVGFLDMTEAVEIDDSQNKVLFGDVLFTTSSETPEEVGMSSVWLGNAENTYLNSFCFGYRPMVEFNPYYLAYMLRSSSMRKNITFLAQGISRYNISKNKMMDIKMPIPNIEEQKQIGSYFRSLDNLITLHQLKLEKLKNIKKSMLKKMFV